MQQFTLAYVSAGVVSVSTLLIGQCNPDYYFRWSCLFGFSEHTLNWPMQQAHSTIKGEKRVSVSTLLIGQCNWTDKRKRTSSKVSVSTLLIGQCNGYGDLHSVIELVSVSTLLIGQCNKEVVMNKDPP